MSCAAHDAPHVLQRSRVQLCIMEEVGLVWKEVGSLHGSTRLVLPRQGQQALWLACPVS